MDNVLRIKCDYCGQERPAEELKLGTIRFITRRGPNKVSATKNRWFCADKPCHSNSQFAHEG